MLNITFLSLIVLLIIPAANVYTGGTRSDSDERYNQIPGAHECWIDGYDAGFFGKYDEDRANECNEIPGQSKDPEQKKHGCEKGVDSQGWVSSGENCYHPG